MHEFEKKTAILITKR